MSTPRVPHHEDVRAQVRTKLDAVRAERTNATPMIASGDTPTTTVAVRRKPVVRFLNTVTPEPVDWIWPGRFARGKLILLAGEPGVGKTFLLLDAASRISRGGAFPDGTVAPRGRCLILTAEDGIADTIRPRVDASGGDIAQIAVLEAIAETNGTRSTVSLTKDLDMLMQAVREVRPIFVGIDPISAYLGGTDTHRDAEVRSTLAPLIDMAEQEHFALVAICHLSKDAQKAALHRPGGSIAFVAAARIVLAVAADPNDATRRLLAPIKSNLCRPASTLAYRIVDDRLQWEPDPVEMDAAAIFQMGSPADHEDHSDAARVIADLLADEASWPMDAKDALAAGQAHGIPDRTLRHAAAKRNIRICRSSGFGGRGKWLWHRPDAIPARTAPAHPAVAAMAPIAAMEIHSEKEEEV